MSSIILCFVCFMFSFVVVVVVVFVVVLFVLFINNSIKPVGEIVYQPPVFISPVLHMKLTFVYACLVVCPSIKQVQVSSIGHN